MAVLPNVAVLMVDYDNDSLAIVEDLIKRKMFMFRCATVSFLDLPLAFRCLSLTFPCLFHCVSLTMLKENKATHHTHTHPGARRVDTV